MQKLGIWFTLMLIYTMPKPTHKMDFMHSAIK